MNYNKLVRDRVPEIIRQKGSNPITRNASGKEYFAKLCEKLEEEAKEFLEKPRKDELADILEVVYALRDHKNINAEELEKHRAKKALERGSFRQKIILEETK